MNFFKKMLSSLKESSKETEVTKPSVDLSLDDSFVQQFISKGGKFLYCTTMDEVVINLNNIFEENKWANILCHDYDLKKLLTQRNITITDKFNNKNPFFTSCEHLIAQTGEILLSSNQLKSHKIASYADNFIVYATTSQLVKDKGEGLTGIKHNYQGNLPSNISSINSYTIKQDEDDLLTAGGNNSKNLYLILFEDL